VLHASDSASLPIATRVEEGGEDSTTDAVSTTTTGRATNTGVSSSTTERFFSFPDLYLLLLPAPYLVARFFGRPCVLPA
jgi:hypothetical protein